VRGLPAGILRVLISAHWGGVSPGAGNYSSRDGDCPVWAGARAREWHEGDNMNISRPGLALGSAAALCVLALLGGCARPPVATAPPSSSTSEATSAPAPAPDYSQASNWLSAPSSADASKPVDVYFLYPTIYQQANPSAPMVCSADNAQMRAGAPAAFSRTATAFSPLANVYAPYYRQAAIQVLKLPRDKQNAIVGGEPTTDALAAFDYYIQHFNGGRPFILAGHSQGSNIMINVMADYMKKHPDVYKRMIAAYVPGYSITPEYLARNSELKFAQSADDTQVIVAYNTVAPGTKEDPVILPGAMVINPITWTRSEATATAEQNLGSISLDASGYPVLDAQGQPKKELRVADARIDTAKGQLICSSVNTATLSPGNGMVAAGIFHNYDYPFYYFDIRANAANRIARYLANR
jgi:hypothetical protein